ncbi:MAG: ROK family protein [Vicinamibacterales bacterium]
MRIGIDLGGTKIEGIALADDGATLARERVPTPAGDYAATVAAVVALVGRLEAQAGTTGTVGVGIPGVVSPATGLVKNANSTCLIGRPLDVDLARALGRKVRLANDANCFALSEATDGAAHGADVVFGVILGTGVGGGIVSHGRILTGANAVAGEWGHNPLPWPADDERPGPPCYCGRCGCLETFLSGPGLSLDYAARGGVDGIAPADIVVRAQDGDAAAVAALARHADRLARGLATIINVLDPDVIVLGGGVSQIDSIYDEVPRRWSAYVFSDRVDTRLARAAHGDASGVRGAAWLWPPMGAD